MNLATYMQMKIPVRVINSTYTHSGLTNGTTYYYRISSEDQYFNESAKSTEVNAVPVALAVTTQPANKNICAGGNTTFSVTANTATGYRWQVDANTGAYANITNGGVYSNATTNTLTITGAAATMNGYLYRCVVSNADETVNALPATLTVTSISLAPTQVNVSCNGGSNGAASVVASGGSGAYTYVWSPSISTTAGANGLVAGTYTVTVTDASGCTASRAFTITQPSLLNTSGSQTNVSCNGGTNGTATVTASGGSGGYTYLWSNGGTTATITGLMAGNYRVTVTDANACTAIRDYTITQQSAITTSTTQVNVSCNGGSNGSATVTASGGAGAYTYLWTPSGGTGATATGLVAGTYNVQVTDANACTKNQSVTILQPAALVATAGAKTNVSCNGGSNGSATVNVTGGTGSYTYSWSPSGGTAASATGLVAGTYTVTVKDANLCQTTESFTITQPSLLNASASQTNVSCNGGSNGTATVTVTGGTGAYTYSWLPRGGTAATASG
ncbi:MAG: hypothetical protein EOO86_18315, partial [Pedobacter sp.]